MCNIQPADDTRSASYVQLGPADDAPPFATRRVSSAGMTRPTLLELVAQALMSTEAGYDRLAPKFDATPFRTPDAILEVMAARIGPIDRALDVCCGTGAAMRWLRPQCRESVVGLDFSAGMLAEARRRLEDAPGSAAIELVRGDALAMTYYREFDVITCVGALGHIVEDDEDRFVAGIARALRPGGRFVFVTGERPSPASRGWWMAHAFNVAMRARNALVKPQFVMYYLTFLWPDVRPLLERHGFEVTVARGVFPLPYERALLVTATRSCASAPFRGSADA